MMSGYVIDVVSLVGEVMCLLWVGLFVLVGGGFIILLIEILLVGVLWLMGESLGVSDVVVG